MSENMPEDTRITVWDQQYDLQQRQYDIEERFLRLQAPDAYFHYSSQHFSPTISLESKPTMEMSKVVPADIVPTTPPEDIQD